MGDFAYERQLITSPDILNDAAIYTVGNSERLRPESILAALTTTALAGNRLPWVIYLSPDGTQLGIYVAGALVPPSTTVTVTFALDYSQFTSTAGPFSRVTGSLPDTVLEPGSTIGLGTFLVTDGTIPIADAWSSIALWGISETTAADTPAQPLLQFLPLAEQVG